MIGQKTEETNPTTRRIASPWRRLLAGLIDFASWILILEILLWWVTSAGTIDHLLGSLTTALILLIFLLPVGSLFYVSAMTSWFGGTLGKLLCGIKIVNHDGQLLSFWRAFFRNHIGYMMSGLCFWLGFFWIFIDKERRGWHDMIVDTYVVVKRQLGYIIGIAALLIILAINAFLGITVAQQISDQSPFYQDILADIVEEIKSPPLSAPGTETY